MLAGLLNDITHTQLYTKNLSLYLLPPTKLGRNINSMCPTAVQN